MFFIRSGEIWLSASLINSTKWNELLLSEVKMYDVAKCGNVAIYYNELIRIIGR